MQEYISQQHRVLLPAEQIYAVISRFDNLTPALADRVEEWQADEERCSFKAKGFTVKLRMEERIEPKHVKIVGDEGGVPMDFAFWIRFPFSKSAPRAICAFIILSVSSRRIGIKRRAIDIIIAISCTGT